MDLVNVKDEYYPHYKMKYYLILLLIIIMGAGARTMFEIAYQGMAFEHDEMSHKVAFLIGIAVWYVAMMIADILILTSAERRKNVVYVGLLTAGVAIPAIYMAFNH